jgi:hypothetical protein
MSEQLPPADCVRRLLELVEAIWLWGSYQGPRHSSDPMERNDNCNAIQQDFNTQLRPLAEAACGVPLPQQIDYCLWESRIESVRLACFNLYSNYNPILLDFELSNRLSAASAELRQISSAVLRHLTAKQPPLTSTAQTENTPDPHPSASTSSAMGGENTSANVAPLAAAAGNDTQGKGKPGGTTSTAKPKRRGRKPTNPTDTKRIYEAWATGRYRTVAELARELRTTAKDVKKALDRSRPPRKKSTP